MNGVNEKETKREYDDDDDDDTFVQMVLCTTGWLDHCHLSVASSIDVHVSWIASVVCAYGEETEY